MQLQRVITYISFSSCSSTSHRKNQPVKGKENGSSPPGKQQHFFFPQICCLHIAVQQYKHLKLVRSAQSSVHIIRKETASYDHITQPYIFIFDSKNDMVTNPEARQHSIIIIDDTQWHKVAQPKWLAQSQGITRTILSTASIWILLRRTKFIVEVHHEPWL